MSEKDIPDLFAWEPAPEPLRFNGPEYVPSRDRVRLTRQIRRITLVMADGRWRTLHEIETATGDPPASISAQLRHLRKDRFGASLVERRARAENSNGLYEYRLELSDAAQAALEIEP